VKRNRLVHPVRRKLNERLNQNASFWIRKPRNRIAIMRRAEKSVHLNKRALWKVQFLHDY
jgi:hypothetical protein